MSTSTKAGPSRSDRPVLEVRQICKSFPGVRVLKSVNLSIWPGEVHAFMGDWQLVIKGAVIILAVMLDKLRTRGQAG
jgi:predicted ABC-type sugar transport system permease subunit